MSVENSMLFASVAQWIEQGGSNALVGGSSPSGGANLNLISEIGLNEGY